MYSSIPKLQLWFLPRLREKITLSLMCLNSKPNKNFGCCIFLLLKSSWNDLTLRLITFLTSKIMDPLTLIHEISFNLLILTTHLWKNFISAIPSLRFWIFANLCCTLILIMRPIECLSSLYLYFTFQKSHILSLLVRLLTINLAFSILSSKFAMWFLWLRNKREF